MRYLLTLVLFAYLFPTSVQAHVLKIDKNIGAVLHIDPEDNPVAGQPATFNFDITDKDNHFSLSTCDCRIVISHDHAEILNNSYKVGLTYTFPEAGIYKITLEGKPANSDQFSTFHLDYDVRVEREQKQAQPNHAAHYIIFGIGFIVLSVLYFKGKNYE